MYRVHRPCATTIGNTHILHAGIGSVECVERVKDMKIELNSGVKPRIYFVSAGDGWWQPLTFIGRLLLPLLFRPYFFFSVPAPGREQHRRYRQSAVSVLYAPSFERHLSASFITIIIIIVLLAKFHLRHFLISPSWQSTFEFEHLRSERPYQLFRNEFVQTQTICNLIPKFIANENVGGAGGRSTATEWAAFTETISINFRFSLGLQVFRFSGLLRRRRVHGNCFVEII